MRVGDYLKGVGGVIRELRMACDLSQEELAERAKMSRNMLSGVETGRFNPSLRKLVDLSNALKVTPGALLTQVDERIG